MHARQRRCRHTPPSTELRPQIANRSLRVEWVASQFRWPWLRCSPSSSGWWHGSVRKAARISSAPRQHPPMRPPRRLRACSERWTAVGSRGLLFPLFSAPATVPAAGRTRSCERSRRSGLSPKGASGACPRGHSASAASSGPAASSIQGEPAATGSPTVAVPPAATPEPAAKTVETAADPLRMRR